MFYDDLPRQDRFAALAGTEAYTPLPEDWVVGVADIVRSTEAIGAGRYKTVNMVGAAILSAQINAAGARAFPYVFGGDGAGFAHPGTHAAIAAEALAAVQVWAREAFDLELRIGLFPVSEIRAAGHDVQVARFQASAGVDYAMFAGGGLAWADAQIKAGAQTVPAAAPGTQPDLTGLSCRWSHMQARHGCILSLLIVPAPGADPDAVGRVIQQILDLVGALERGGHPVPAAGPDVRWPRGASALESRVPDARGARQGRLGITFQVLLAWVFLRFGLKAGGFDAAAYREAVGQNADFRKFDDGLKMTIDCDPATVARIRALLEQAKDSVRFGLHEQHEAMMTCIVPSLNENTHVHFVDGADGGYASAARALKETP